MKVSSIVMIYSQKDSELLTSTLLIESIVFTIIFFLWVAAILFYLFIIIYLFIFYVNFHNLFFLYLVLLRMTIFLLFPWLLCRWCDLIIQSLSGHVVSVRDVERISSIRRKNKQTQVCFGKNMYLEKVTSSFIVLTSILFFVERCFFFRMQSLCNLICILKSTPLEQKKTLKFSLSLVFPDLTSVSP